MIGKRFNKLAGFVAVILAVVVMAIIAIVANKNSMKSSTESSGIVQKDNWNQSVSIKERYGDGTVTGEIVIGGAYYNGYCMKHGARLIGGQDSLNYAGSAYTLSDINATSGNEGKIRWLLDNMLRVNLSTSNVSSEEEAFYRENLKQIILKSGKDEYTANTMIASLDNATVFQIQQYVLWYYTRNVSSALPSWRNDSSDARAVLYNALIAEANNHSNYNSDGTESVTVAKANNCTIVQDGTNVWVGPISINNSIGKMYKFTYSDFIIGSNSSAKAFQSDKATEIVNNSYTDYSGNIYIRFENYDLSTPGTHTATGKINALTYKTTADYWIKGTEFQPVITLSREAVSNEVSISTSVVKNINGQYSLKIRKVDQAGKDIKLNNNIFTTTINNNNAAVKNISGAYVTYSTVQIDKDSGDQNIIITESSAIPGYEKFEGTINVVLSKAMNSDKTAYVANLKSWDVTGGNKNNVSVDVNSSTKVVTVTIKNQKIDYYKVSLFKDLLDNAGWTTSRGIANVKFSVQQYVKDGSSYKKNDNVVVTSAEAKAAIANFNNTDYTSSNGVVLNRKTVGEDFYRYVITEASLPENNIFNSVSWNGKGLVIDVTPAYDSSANKYVVDHVNVYLANVDSNNGSVSNKEAVTRISRDETKVISVKESEDLYIYVASNSSLTIGIKDPVISGKYNLNLAKVEQDNTAVKDKSSYIAGAKYEVKRFLDISAYSTAKNMSYVYETEEGAENTNPYAKEITTETNKVALYGDDINITTDNYGKYDVYFIQETQNSGTYNLDSNVYKVIVSKKAEGSTGNKKYVVNNVEVFKRNSSYIWDKVDTETSREIYANVDGDIVNIVTSDRKKIYDLALTKTIVYSGSETVEKFDYNFDGVVNANDASMLLNIRAQMGVPTTIETITQEEAEEIVTRFRSEKAAEYNNFATESSYSYINANRVKQIVELFRTNGHSNYKFIDGYTIFEKFMNLDSNYDGFVPETEIKNILQIAASKGAKLDNDRINGVDASKINTYEDNSQITTGIYNLNKTTYKIDKSDVVTYKITVYNEGDYDAENVKIVDYIPEGLVICDQNGNKVTEGTVTCNYKGTDYVWTIEDGSNGKKAAYTIPETIEKFNDAEKKLDKFDAYIYCCVDYESIDENGVKTYNEEKINEYASLLNPTIFYNVAEIIDSTPVDAPAGTKDRDSSENTIPENTGKSIIQEIIDTYEDTFTGAYPNNSSSCVKGNYDYQDDDDFERIMIGQNNKEFDLSLRKSITKVGSNLDNLTPVTYTEDEVTRLPGINSSSVDACTRTGTGEYYHKKEAVSVNAKDYVEYTIRVYNEGAYSDYAGYAKEITDYLPNELEFVGVVDYDGSIIKDSDRTDENKNTSNLGNGLGNWSWKYYNDNNENKIVLTANNTTALSPKGNLAVLDMVDESEYISYYANTSADFNPFLYEYQEIKLICYVKEDANENKPITNIAEITKYVKVDGNEEAEVNSDRDSTKGTIKTTTGNYNAQNQDVNLETYYADRNVNESDDITSYYPGLEDDDDFETVLIKVGSYSLDILKLSEDEFTTDAQESINSLKTKDIEGAEFVVKQFVDAENSNAPYEQRIGTFITNSRSNNYTNKYIVKTLSNGNIEVYESDEENNKIGEAIQNPFEKIKITNVNKSDMYVIEEITAPDGFKNRNKITAFLVNKKEVNGKYVIDTTNESLSNNARSLVKNAGIINVLIEKNGGILTRDNIKLDNEGNRIINEDGSYYVFQSDVTEDEINNSTRIDYTDNKIVISIANSKLTGEYSIAINKIDENNEYVGNIKFNVSGVDGNGNEIVNKELTTDSTESAYEIVSRDINKDNAAAKDTYTITEDAQTAISNGYYPLANPIILEVEKGKNDDSSAYKVSKYSFKVNGENIAYDITENGTLTINNVLLQGTDRKATINITLTDNSIEIKVENIKLNFDLSLRKYIVKVAEQTYNDRTPNVDVAGLTEGTTAYYNHTKEALKVEKGNVITYNLTVYNEGDSDGYAEEIKDYLPAGLVLAKNSTVNNKYGWKMYDQNGNITENEAQAVYVASDYLSKAKGEARSEDTVIKALGLETSSELTDEKKAEMNTKLANSAKTIQVELQVSNNAAASQVGEAKKYLTNRAEITKYGYFVDTTWVEADAQDVDRDSVQNTISDNLELNTWYTENVIDGEAINGTYYPGVQDDDDFETVYVQEIVDEYSLKLVKTLENGTTKVSGIGFLLNDETTPRTTSRKGQIDFGTYSITAENLSVKDLYTIKEVEVSNSKYYQLKDPITLYVSKVRSGDKYVVEGIKLDETDSTYGTTKTKEVALSGTDKKVTLTATVNGNNIKIKVPNIEKKFDLSLRKYITKIGETTYEDRTPDVDLSGFENGTTANYNHTKEAIKVKKGDVITYNLTVYNEGDIDGYAQEIKDYLPAGLMLAENSEINEKYGWTMFDENGEETTDRNNTAYVVSYYLSKDEGEERSENTLIDALELGNYASLTEAQKTEMKEKLVNSSKTVQIELVVKDTEYATKYLTNRAEITSYGYYDETNGNAWHEANQAGIDRDSTQNTIKNDLNLDDWYTDNVTNGNPINGTYYPGVEDDDDFETVMIENDTVDVSESKKWEGTDHPEKYRATFKLYKEVKTSKADKSIMYIEDLVDLSFEVNEGDSYASKNVALTNSLDFKEDSSYRNPNIPYTRNGVEIDLNKDGSVQTVKEELTLLGGIGFTPVGDADNAFSGSFYGQGYEIKNIYINSDELRYAGLFGVTDGAVIRDLGVSGNISVSGNRFIGGIAGRINNTQIINCNNKVNLNSQFIGGIAGQLYHNNTISYCSNSIDLKGNNVAGIAERITGNNNKISNCYNTGNFTSRYAGGIIDGNNGTSNVIENCYNKGNITDVQKTGVEVGGILGNSTSSRTIINNCYNEGNLAFEFNGGNVYVGGIVGTNASDHVANCYNKGNITVRATEDDDSEVKVAGIVSGYRSIVNPCIVNCYNTGNIGVNIKNSVNLNRLKYVGGITTFISTGTEIIANCYNTGKIDTSVEESGYIYGGAIIGYVNTNVLSSYKNKTKDNYYLDNNSKAIGNIESAEQLTSMTENEMKDTNFATLLNNNKQIYSSYSTNTYNLVNWDTWSFVENDYPTLVQTIDNTPVTPEKFDEDVTLVEVTDIEEKEIIVYGNSTAIFKNLPKLDDGLEYVVKEILAEKYNEKTGTWIPLEEGVDYTLTEDKKNKRKTNTVEENEDGKYRILINKVDEEDNYLSGVIFKTISTDSSGRTIEDNAVTARVTTDGTSAPKQVVSKDITEENYTEVDLYEITESIEDESLSEYLKLADPIKITVSKILNDKKYVAKEFTVNGNKVTEQGLELNVKLEGETEKTAKVKVTLSENVLLIVVQNVKKEKVLTGNYNFTVTKKDASTTQVIKDEKTTFDIKVYSNMNEEKDDNGTKVTFDSEVALKDINGKTINTKGIKASTNGVATIGNILITKEDLEAKTYYFVVEETQAPDEYSEIDYKVVVPVTFTETTDSYIAIHDTTKAFALVKDSNGKEYRKELKEMSTNANECVSTENTNVAINVNVPNQLKGFDLSLRKYITKVNGDDVEVSREPEVDISKLGTEETVIEDGKEVKKLITTATYEHTKEPLLVSPKDTVEYTLRIYNEGEISGYANLVMDDIPEGVQMVAPAKDEDGRAQNMNAEYRWVMYRRAEDGEISEDIIVYNKVTYIPTENAEEAELIVTDYLSKDNGEAMMTEADTQNPNLIKPINVASGEVTEENYRDIKVEFKVKPSNKEGKIITNYAQITDDSDRNGNSVIDRDSTPNEWNEGEDDQDFDRIKVRYFDLALYKWVTSALVTEDGKTVEYASNHDEFNKDYILDVVIPKKKLDKITVKFEYKIKVENQGNLEGYAKEIKDHIPEGLEFHAEDNEEFGWVQQPDGTITTDYLKDTLLKPGETAEVTVILTWLNNENNLGLKVNNAEISKDYNKYDSPDIDSTPNNFKNTPVEDDEDSDIVMLQIRTGSFYVMYIIIAMAVVVIIAVGAYGIQEYVVSREERNP